MVIIESNVELDEKGREKEFMLHMIGHAGSANKGRDIVCASASILYYTLAQTANVLAANGKLADDPVIRSEEGNGEVRFKPKAKHRAECAHCYCTIMVGLQLLAMKYPLFVQFRKMRD
jgi:uncharacterized protein YsxB (DUF464 family)